MKIVALPRDPNPYQRLLYGELEKLGCSVRYAGELTPSHTLNVLLLPLELAVYRALGWRVLHLHWVYCFNFAGVERLPALRRVSQAWFGLVLRSARALGMRVAWTAHNALPHRRVFHDDRAARRALVRASDVVFVHSQATREELAALGAAPARAELVPHGPIAPVNGRPPAARRNGDGARRLLFFGRVEEYKGVEELVRAVSGLPPEPDVRLVVAGATSDAALARRLVEQADPRVELRLEHVPDAELSRLVLDSDVVVLPFRRVTTSGSAIMAMAHARPVLLPDLPAFAELPDGAVIKYGGDLSEALRRVLDLPRSQLDAIGAAAHEHTARFGWPEAARRLRTNLWEAAA